MITQLDQIMPITVQSARAIAKEKYNHLVNSISIESIIHLQEEIQEQIDQGRVSGMVNFVFNVDNQFTTPISSNHYKPVLMIQVHTHQMELAVLNNIETHFKNAGYLISSVYYDRQGGGTVAVKSIQW